MAGNTVRVATQVTGAGKASSDIDRLRDKFDKLQKQGAKGFAIGAGAAVTSAGLNLIGQAASGLVSEMADVVEKGMADEESQNRLGASLRANVPAWDGSTDAIERRIKASQRLGFSDETMRDSLTVLVGATHDVTKAQQIQATAMDLARYKGISLADASEALIKVEAGVYRSLKSLGIVLRDGATQTEALAAVQAVATGQADAYANTTSGKATKATIVFDEALEHLGKSALPLVVAGMEELANLIAPEQSLERLREKAAALDFESQVHLRALEDAAKRFGVTLSQAFDAADAAGSFALDDIGKHLASVSGSISNFPGKAADDLAIASDAFKGLEGASKSAKTHIIKDIGDMADAFDATWSDLASTAQQAADDIFGPLERRAALNANRTAQGKDLATIQNPKSKADEVQAARADLIGLQKDFFTLTAEMAGRGELTKKEIGKLNVALKDELKSASNEEAVSILALMALLDRLAGKVNTVFGKLGNANRDQTGSGPLMGGKAAGGPVRKGVPVIVGENHREVFIPPSDGYIDPRDPARPSGGSAAATTSTGGGWTDPAIVRALDRQTAYLARLVAQEPRAASPQTARGDLARQSALMPGGRL